MHSNALTHLIVTGGSRAIREQSESNQRSIRDQLDSNQYDDAPDRDQWKPSLTGAASVRWSIIGM
jgi:hypothetical protein